MKRQRRQAVAILLAAVLALTATPASAAKPDPGGPAAPTGTEITRPRNDNFGRAIVLPAPGHYNGRNTGATLQAGEPRAIRVNPGGNSVWWVWRARATRKRVITTGGSNFDTILSVYPGRTRRSLRRIVANDDFGNGLQSRVAFRVYAGNLYRIQVSGYRYQNQTGRTASSGRITLRVIKS